MGVYGDIYGDLRGRGGVHGVGGIDPSAGNSHNHVIEIITGYHHQIGSKPQMAGGGQ